AVVVDEHLRTGVQGVLAAGEALGIGGLDAALVEGEIAGLVAAERPVPGALSARRRRARRFAARLAETFAPRPDLAERPDAETVVCRCEDVRWGEIDPTWSMRQAKLYRRTGMGPCQARVCGPALRHLCGWDADRVRPPIEPVATGVLASEAGEAE
ncbi:MAG: (2Fe-2S)-binding protein, partial [Thermoanaerobaculia bacterium]|nr:(2Fe-2S)-binding protein [Thermoanaerobaculia bacterium]